MHKVIELPGGCHAYAYGTTRYEEVCEKFGVDPTLSATINGKVYVGEATHVDDDWSYVWIECSRHVVLLPIQEDWSEVDLAVYVARVIECCYPWFAKHAVAHVNQLLAGEWIGGIWPETGGWFFVRTDDPKRPNDG